MANNLKYSVFRIVMPSIFTSGNVVAQFAAPQARRGGLQREKLLKNRRIKLSEGGKNHVRVRYSSSAPRRCPTRCQADPDPEKALQFQQQLRKFLWRGAGTGENFFVRKEAPCEGLVGQRQPDVVCVGKCQQQSDRLRAVLQSCQEHI